MNKNSCLYLLIILFVSSCKTVSLSETSKTETTQQHVLGSIGSGKSFLLQKGFNSAALPTYKTPIKIALKVKPFKKQLFKSFLKAKALQSDHVNLNYVDSLDIKPRYIELEIADKVALVTALNTKENSNVKAYLSNNASANIITNLSMALNQQDFEKLAKAESVFLVENGLKTYALQLYDNGKKTDKISFNKAVIFAYKTANCCWQEDNRRNLNIVDLVDPFNSCPNKTYRSANKAKKKVKLF